MEAFYTFHCDEYVLRQGWILEKNRYHPTPQEMIRPVLIIVAHTRFMLQLYLRYHPK